jgi:hypothetical protein
VWFLALFTIVLSGFVLGLSVFPGFPQLLPRDWVYGVGGGLIFLLLVACVRHVMRPASPERPRRRVSTLLVLLAIVVTPALLLMNVPRRLMFERYQSRFEELRSHAPPPDYHSPSPLNADFELFWVDQWGTDRRGGVYFRTLATGERGGQEHRSFGYAYQPNREGSPFGDGGYELQHLTGDWYSFAATDE